MLNFVLWATVMQVQCNVFEGASGEVALTAAGGLRRLPGLTETYENAALVYVHYMWSPLVEFIFASKLWQKLSSSSLGETSCFN